MICSMNDWFKHIVFNIIINSVVDFSTRGDYCVQESESKGPSVSGLLRLASAFSPPSSLSVWLSCRRSITIGSHRPLLISIFHQSCIQYSNYPAQVIFTLTSLYKPPPLSVLPFDRLSFWLEYIYLHSSLLSVSLVFVWETNFVWSPRHRQRGGFSTNSRW